MCRAKSISGVLKLLGLFALFIASPANAGEMNPIDPVWVSRAKLLIPSAREKYIRQSAQLSEAGELNYIQRPDSRVPYRNRRLILKTFQNNRKNLFEKTTIIEGDEANSTTEIICRNDIYRFSLKKTAPNKSFVMVEYDKLSPDDQSFVGGGLSSYPYEYLLLLLWAVEQRDGHTLKALHWDEASRSLYSMFDVIKGATIQTNELWMEPDAGWRIVRRAATSPKQINTFQVVYGTMIEDVAYPVEVNASTIAKGQDKQPSYDVHVIVEIKKCDLPDSSYRLSAFGLPEPVDIEATSKRIPNYIWLLTGAAVSLLLAFGLRYLCKRNRIL